MKSVVSILLSTFLLVGLNGCVSNPEATQAEFDQRSPQRLCMHYLTTDGLNIYRPYSKRAIIKRNIDCRPYAEMARIAYENERAMWNSLYGAVGALDTALGTNQSSTYSSSGTSLSSGYTKVCRYDGMSGPSALTVLANSICPLSHSHNISGMTKICNYPNAMGGPKAITVSTMDSCPLNYPG